MTEKPVDTICGPFSRERMESLRETLKEADAQGISRDEITKFEGNDLLISFGKYLLDHLDMQFASKGHSGL